MSLILNIETSSEICSIALAQQGKILATAESEKTRSHASTLALLIQDLVKNQGMTIRDLDAIAVSMGPGSYTGLRIGVSVAKGLCYGASLPLIAVNTLLSMFSGIQESHLDFRKQFKDNTLFCPMLDARRLEVYMAIFDMEGKQIKDTRAEILDEESFQDLLNQHPMVFFGSGSEKCRNLIKHEQAYFIEAFEPKASYMASLSEQYFQNNQFEDVAYFEPFYLKDFVATTPKRKVI